MKHAEATPITDAFIASREYPRIYTEFEVPSECLDLARALELDRANLIAALEWARQQLGKHTRPSPIDKALAESERRFNQEKE